MTKAFHKTKPAVKFVDFLAKCKAVTEFKSSTGKRYSVKHIDKEEMVFKRLDAKKDLEWRMNLKNVFRAYQELEDFATINFKPFVPIVHSPARGLLVHLGMLE